MDPGFVGFGSFVGRLPCPPWHVLDKFSLDWLGQLHWLHSCLYNRAATLAESSVSCRGHMTASLSGVFQCSVVRDC